MTREERNNYHDNISGVNPELSGLTPLPITRVEKVVRILAQTDSHYLNSSYSYRKGVRLHRFYTEIRKRYPDASTEELFTLLTLEGF